MNKISLVMATCRPTVAIIMLNWNGWRDTIECLESLNKVQYDNLEVIVVDNASRDESLEKIESWCNKNEILCHKLFRERDNIEIIHALNSEEKCCGSGAIKKLALISLNENAGFCLGNNIGMRHAAANGAEFFLILNNDTIVTPNFLKPMVEVAQQDENIGLVGGIICYAENPDLIWFAGGSFDKYLENVRLYDGEFYSGVAFDLILNTDWVSGCMTLIPRRVYDRLGGYYEGYYIYSEEWEYSLRAKKAGYRLVIASRARIFHKIGHSLPVMMPLSYYYGTRNRLMLKRMYLSRSLRWPFLTFFLLSRIPRYIYFALRGRWDLVRAGSAAIWDYFIGKTGKWRDHAD
jgi:GT2 family glycosyltransferase